MATEASEGSEVVILNLKEAAALLRVSRPTLLELTKRKSIPCRKVGREWRFVKQDVLAWLSGNDRALRSRR